MNNNQEQFIKKPTVLIAGYGIVGHNIKNIFYWADCYDINIEEFKYIKKDKYDFCFICVPTPMNKNGDANISEVENVIINVNAEFYIIKSTVPPKTTELLNKKYNKKIIFSPEYEGITQHANVKQDFVILGGDLNITYKVSQLYQYVFNCDLKIIQVDSTTAELAKYMENSYLATKVVFCNEFYRIAQKLGVNYNILRECFCADSRINRSHTFVYEDYPYYDSKCLNKDLPAIINEIKKYGYDANFIKGVVEINNKFKKESLC